MNAIYARRSPMRLNASRISSHRFFPLAAADLRHVECHFYCTWSCCCSPLFVGVILSQSLNTHSLQSLLLGANTHTHTPRRSIHQQDTRWLDFEVIAKEQKVYVWKKAASLVDPSELCSVVKRCVSTKMPILPTNLRLNRDWLKTKGFLF